MSTRVVLVGVSGYGARHLAVLRRLEDSGSARIVALVDRDVANFSHAERHRTGSVFETTNLDTALSTVEADLVVVATPPHTHLALATTVLRRGLALYLEKPPVPLLQDLDVLSDLVRPGQRVEVGFHLTRRTLRVLKDVWGAGLIGEVQRITAHAALARADSYYDRTAWAGRWFLDGAAVLDGPLFNPCAHILHAALMAAREICPEWQAGHLSAECYSVRAIDGDDLIAARVLPRGRGPVIVATATTAADEVIEPSITMHGTRGEVTVRHRDGEARLSRSGEQTIIPAPTDGPSALETAVLNPHNEGDEFLDLAAVRPYVLTVNGIVETCGTPHRIGAHRARAQRDGENFQYLPGVASAIRRVTSQGTLFSENQEPWASPPAKSDLHGYKRFSHPNFLASQKE